MFSSTVMPPGDVLPATDPDLHEQACPTALPHRFKDSTWEPGPVLRGAAVLVGAGVDPGVEELAGQPAVPVVNHHPVEANGPEVLGGVSELPADPRHPRRVETKIVGAASTRLRKVWVPTVSGLSRWG